MLNQDSIRTLFRFLPACTAVLMSLAILLPVTGCGTTKGPASASFASVIIKNHTEAEIIAATTQVFAADGYKGGPSGLGKMLFEKEASRATTLGREGLVGTAYGAQTFIRVRVETVELPGSQYRLQCKAYTVSGGSDPFFQNEVAYANFRSGPWQSLLNKVKKQLP
jgi:hypothetical protein